MKPLIDILTGQACGSVGYADDSRPVSCGTSQIQTDSAYLGIVNSNIYLVLNKSLLSYSVSVILATGRPTLGYMETNRIGIQRLATYF